MAWVQDGFEQNARQGDVLGLLGNLAEGLGREAFGIDDFMRVASKAKKGDFMGALKSLGTGALELGTTIIPGGERVKAAKLGKLVPKTAMGAKALRKIGALDSAGQLTRSAVPRLRTLRATNWGYNLGGPIAGMYMESKEMAAKAAQQEAMRQQIRNMMQSYSPQQSAMSYLSNTGGM